MVKHPVDWCYARCGVPLDQVLIEEGWNMHPACEFPESRVKTHRTDELKESLDGRI